MDETVQMLTEIRERLARVETKIDSMTDVRHTAEEAKEIANKALQSTESAHHRINEVRDDMKSMKTGQRWMIGTTLSVVGLFLTAIGLLWKGLGG